MSGLFLAVVSAALGQEGPWGPTTPPADPPPPEDAPPLINDVETMSRLNEALRKSGVVASEKLIDKFRAITGSEDFPVLYHGLDGVKVAYDFIGIAEPKVFATAKAAGKEFPFSNHQPTFVVDLNAIPLGAKVASVMVMELLAKK